MSETALPLTWIDLPPTQADLPYDDGVPMESARHKAQMDLLMDALDLWLAQRDDGFVGGNMFVYYSLAQVRNQDFKGPDVFVVLGVPKGERKSWVVWEEGKAPDVVIELLSESTAAADKTTKKLIYQNQMRVSDYFWYDPFSPDDWAGFSLQQGVYQPLIPNAQEQLVSRTLGLALQRWQGTYRDMEATWLRWTTLTGELLPTSAEQARQQAEQERQRAEQACQQAEQERQQAEQARQQAEQERQRAEQACQQAEQERQQAEQARQQAEQERQRAEQACQQAEQERQQAEQARQQAEQERQRAETIATQLRQTARSLLATGMSPTQVAEITGLHPETLESME